MQTYGKDLCQVNDMYLTDSWRIRRVVDHMDETPCRGVSDAVALCVLSCSGNGEQVMDCV